MKKLMVFVVKKLNLSQIHVKWSKFWIVQLFSKQFGEEILFQMGHAYQQETDWHTKRPVLSV